ncbi:MAG TPA: ATP synthase F1 subunit delta [Vicinamibacterales bacterium]|nr:ATP synthase F1 subunit delta [Vicinamibacterales bacterium]
MTPRAAAGRYARALFDVALKERVNLRAVAGDLEALTTLVDAHADLKRALSNPAIPAARKRAVVEALLARAPLAPLVSRTVMLLADRDRLVLLDDLSAAFRERLMEHEQVVRAEVTTAIELPPERVAALQQGIARATGRPPQHVQLVTRVDPSILGGAVTRIGSTVYDGSITTQLQRLRRRLADVEA